MSTPTSTYLRIALQNRTGQAYALLVLFNAIGATRSALVLLDLQPAILTTLLGRSLIPHTVALPISLAGVAVTLYALYRHGIRTQQAYHHALHTHPASDAVPDDSD